jgi:hypothetical protein
MNAGRRTGLYPKLSETAFFRLLKAAISSLINNSG